MKNRELIQLHSLEKSLVYFSTSLKANEVTLEKMLKMDIMQKYKDDQDVLEDVIIENKQAIEMTDIYSNILSSTMDFFASVISNNLNIVMKVLASVTILMAIPTIIGGIFGMNVALPLQDNPQGFIIIIFLTIILTLITAFILYKKICLVNYKDLIIKISTIKLNLIVDIFIYYVNNFVSNLFLIKIKTQVDISTYTL